MVRVVVVGSFVVDLVVEVPHLPRLHETMLARSAARHLGGKGFNQALTAARMGAAVHMIGRIGDDDGGRAFLAGLAREGVDAAGVSVDPDAGTGFAMPMVVPGVGNSIVLVPGANASLGAAHAAASVGAIRAASALLVQQEVPPEASIAAARLARSAGVPVVLDPAPARSVPELLALADWVVPNEPEAEALVGSPIVDVASGFAAAERLAEGRSGAVVTLGARGVVVVSGSERIFVPPFDVASIDPTGAGDAFAGAFVVALAEGATVAAAARIGAAAGAFAVTRVGAEPGLPRRADLVMLGF